MLASPHTLHWTQLTIDRKILRRLPHNRLAPVRRREIILTLDLLLAAVDGRTTGPYIDVVDARVRLPVCVALCAEILKSQVLASV
jgi:hypothetical protein